MGAVTEAGLSRPQPVAPPPAGEKWTAERVLSIRRWTPTLLSVRLTRNRGFRFTPGHYARLGIGNPEMARDLRSLLAARGFQTSRRNVPGQMAFENYW